MTTISWTRLGPAVATAGDVGGDRQVGESYCARWVRPLAGGYYALITRYFYPAVDSYDDRAQGAEYIEMHTEYLVCTDTNAPGDTEVWSDIVSGVYARSDPTEDAARRAAVAADTPPDDDWPSWAPDWTIRTP